MSLMTILVLSLTIFNASAVTQKILNYSFESGSGSNPSTWTGHNGRYYYGGNAYDRAYVLEMDYTEYVEQSISGFTESDISSLLFYFRGSGKITVSLYDSNGLTWSDLTVTGSPSSWTQAYYIGNDFGSSTGITKIKFYANDNGMKIDYVLLYITDGGPH